MNAYHFTHLGLLALGGKVEGRTKLQKSIYFLGILAGYIESLGYRAHFYGPYSDAVAEAVNRLKSLGFVQQTRISAGWYDDSGFELARHDLALTDEGKAVAEKKAEENQDVWKKIEEAAKRLTAAGDIDYVRMSVAAKTYYMVNQADKPVTPAELAENAKHLGWEVKNNEIEESADFLRKLHLVKTVKTQ